MAPLRPIWQLGNEVEYWLDRISFSRQFLQARTENHWQGVILISLRVKVLQPRV